MRSALIIFDLFAIIYLAILYLTLGVRVKNPDTVFVSGFNMIILRVWISAATAMFTFADVSNFNIIFQILLAVTESLICYIIEDIYGYVIHRYMHYNKKLYTVVHFQHHKNQAECFTTAFYVHPAELVAFYCIGLIIGPGFISLFWHISMTGYNFWLIGATFFLLWSHTGLDISWMPSTSHHDNHHKYYHCNYGTKLSDWIFKSTRLINES